MVRARGTARCAGKVADVLLSDVAGGRPRAAAEKAALETHTAWLRDRRGESFRPHDVSSQVACAGVAGARAALAMLVAVGVSLSAGDVVPAGGPSAAHPSELSVWDRAGRRCVGGWDALGRLPLDRLPQGHPWRELAGGLDYLPTLIELKLTGSFHPLEAVRDCFLPAVARLRTGMRALGAKGTRIRALRAARLGLLVVVSVDMTSRSLDPASVTAVAHRVALDLRPGVPVAAPPLDASAPLWALLGVAAATAACAAPLRKRRRLGDASAFARAASIRAEGPGSWEVPGQAGWVLLLPWALTIPGLRTWLLGWELSLGALREFGRHAGCFFVPSRGGVGGVDQWAMPRARLLEMNAAMAE